MQRIWDVIKLHLSLNAIPQTNLFDVSLHFVPLPSIVGDRSTRVQQLIAGLHSLCNDFLLCMETWVVFWFDSLFCIAPHLLPDLGVFSNTPSTLHAFIIHLIYGLHWFVWFNNTNSIDILCQLSASYEIINFLIIAEMIDLNTLKRSVCVKQILAISFKFTLHLKIKLLLPLWLLFLLSFF